MDYINEFCDNGYLYTNEDNQVVNSLTGEVHTWSEWLKILYPEYVSKSNNN